MENIKLIVEFMGYKKWKPWIAKFKRIEHTKVSTPKGVYDINVLDNHIKTDWNFIMEIIYKIGKTPYSTADGMREYMGINWSGDKISIYSDIEYVYDKIIEFIKWYNEYKY